MGGRAGVGRRLALGDGSSSMDNSAISIKSRSRMCFATLEGSDAAGLKGLLVSRDGDLAGKSGRGSDDLPDAAVAAANMSRPDDPIEKMGSELMVWVMRPAVEACVEQCCIAMAL